MIRTVILLNSSSNKWDFECVPDSLVTTSWASRGRVSALAELMLS